MAKMAWRFTAALHIACCCFLLAAVHQCQARPAIQPVTQGELLSFVSLPHFMAPIKSGASSSLRLAALQPNPFAGNDSPDRHCHYPSHLSHLLVANEGNTSCSLVFNEECCVWTWNRCIVPVIVLLLAYMITVCSAWYGSGRIG